MKEKDVSKETYKWGGWGLEEVGLERNAGSSRGVSECQDREPGHGLGILRGLLSKKSAFPAFILGESSWW